MEKGRDARFTPEINLALIIDKSLQTTYRKKDPFFRRLFLIFSIMIFAQVIFSQKESNVWFFGWYTILDFNFDPPKVGPNAKIFSYEASSSLCDKIGNLMFYSNGQEIYNKNFERVKGWSNPGGNWNYTHEMAQGSLLLPINDSLVFSFALVYTTPNTRSLYLTAINSTLDSGKGEVISGPTKIDSLLTEKMAAVRHADGKKWWLILHKTNTTEFVELLIDVTGGIQRIAYSTGSVHTIDGVAATITFNLQGNQFATATDLGKIDILGFDRCNGLIFIVDSIVKPRIYKYLFYGLSFSPNDRFLYASEAFSDDSAWLYQFDLESQNISNSESLIWFKGPPGNDYEVIGNHQLGPDGKIYIAHFESDPKIRENLGVINSPDSPGLASNFVPYSVSLFPTISDLGLPSFPSGVGGPIYSQAADAGPDHLVCEDTSITLGVPDTSGGRCLFWWSPAWGLDDPTLAQPTYTNLGIDTFFVLTVTDTSVQSQCNSTTDTVWVFHEFPWLVPNAPDLELCLDASELIGLDAQAGFTYLWDPKDGLADPEAATTMAAPGLPMQYILTITDTAMKSSCRSVTDTVIVEIAPCYLPGVIAPGDPGFMQNLEITGIPQGTHLSVYDINGRLVYRSYDYQNDWPNDDRYAAAGLYVYVVEFAEDPFGPLGTREIRKLLVRN